MEKRKWSGIHEFYYNPNKNPLQYILLQGFQIHDRTLLFSKAKPFSVYQGEGLKLNWLPLLDELRTFEREFMGFCYKEQVDKIHHKSILLATKYFSLWFNFDLGLKPI